MIFNRLRTRRSAAAPAGGCPYAHTHPGAHPAGAHPAGPHAAGPHDPGSHASGPHPAEPRTAGAGDALLPADPPFTDPAQATSFIRQFHHEQPAAGGDPDERIRAVLDEIDRTGTYEHTPAELAYGAKLAWRNAARCIGRLYWRSLVVRDLRHLTSADDIAAECFEHLRLAGNGGRIRPVVSVFAPDRPGRPAARILNQQLVRYAGHRTTAADPDDGPSDGPDGIPDGITHDVTGGVTRGVTGDPAGVQLAALARDLGWKCAEDRFEVLPLLIRERPGERPEWYQLPDDTTLEVPLSHPEFAWFAELGLRWYAVPAISDMTLEIGGVRYPAAPFNGWYMGTEIGARNLADPDRYDMLATVAGRLGLDTSNDRTLWRDRALVELNVAVLHSFQEAGVTMADHHTESERFLRHVAQEKRLGRPTPADWSWIVPPVSGGLTPVYHRYYDPVDPSLRPAFLAREPW